MTVKKNKVKSINKPDKSMGERYPQNIPDELFEAWKRLKRTGDVSAIAKKIDSCRPVIDRALKYGHIKDESVKKGINKFFEKRDQEEKEEAKRLLEIAN